MIIDKLVVGNYSTNCYIIQLDKGILIIDPGSIEIEKLLKNILPEAVNIVGIVLTHGHADHIEGVSAIYDKFGRIPVYFGIKEIENMRKSDLNLSIWISGKKIIIDESLYDVRTVSEGDTIFDFKVLETPGHTPGGITLIDSKETIMFSGDTIFEDSYGRTDFIGGNYKILMKSINKLLCYNDSVTVYPGHGNKTTMREYRGWYNSFDGGL